MENLHTAYIEVGNCRKEIAVYCGDVTAFEEPIDILTTSAFVRSYEPTPRTIFRALFDKGICVEMLADDPEIDLRQNCHTWLSKLIPNSPVNISRIGCIELIGRHLFGLDAFEREHSMINSVRAYFRMLDIAAIYGTDISTVALPLLGSGSQHLSAKLLLIPLINECVSFLKRNDDAKRIIFIEKNPEKAALIAESLTQSFRFIKSDKPAKKDTLVFLSYSSGDKNIADNLCFKLESKGIKVWYAPRDVKGPYAAAIADAIECATHFVVILSQNSIGSEHVLNEVDLAFQRLPNNIQFKPLRIDNAMFTPSFKYYLSRQHWMDASDPPLEERLTEFVNSISASI